MVGLERRVEESDFDKLTFFKCALKETLRMHPPIPLLLHETSEDAEVAGYFITKQTRVMINAYAIGRDKDSIQFGFSPGKIISVWLPSRI